MKKCLLLAMLLMLCGTPTDTWDNPGRVMAPGMSFVDTLSPGDRADYYILVPEQIGYYMLKLRNLSEGTEWAAMIFVAQETYPPPYAPGPTDGLCRIATPGTADKYVICLLHEDIEYLVKVDGPTGYGSYILELECLTLSCEEG